MHRNLFTFRNWMLLGLLAVFGAAGCSQESSYPADKLKEHLQEICRSEYGIENIEVKIEDQTIGVYLPLKKLFATDFKESVANGKISNIENLFEPSPEALDKVEDVLFSISRVILSTDRDLEFYVLQATDVESTGLQLVLMGHVNDIKRVRVWDIPRSEYRKRVIHELRLNEAVIWHKPIRAFFEDLPKLTPEKLKKAYFDDDIREGQLNEYFSGLFPQIDPMDIGRWNIVDIRSTMLSQRSAVIYVKVRPEVPQIPQDETRMDVQPPVEPEYLFIVGMNRKQAKISRIIPFQFISHDGGYEKIEFPSELQVGENLSHWNREFILEPISLGGFLAQQATRRVQILIAEDERVRNTLRDVKLEFDYTKEAGDAQTAPPSDDAPPHFVLNLDVQLRGEYTPYNAENLLFHEDIRYLLDIVSREFLKVLRGYDFGQYDYLKLNVSQDPNAWILGRENLELFRRNKIDMKALLSSF